MILSVSRRTDIPAYYSEWFCNRMKEGFVYVPNPMNIHAISKIEINPDVVDAIVFWSKNPQPMLDHLEAFEDYPYYFQFTLNAYEADIETRLPPLAARISSFMRLSDKLGPHRVVWRYDPILITEKYSIEWHIQNYEHIAKSLRGYTERSVFSFLDEYEKIKGTLSRGNIHTLRSDEMKTTAKAIAAISSKCGMQAETCAELIDLTEFNIGHSHCIDARLIQRISGYRLDIKKDKNQRPECGCVESIDIGMYNTCCNGCLYCYANYNQTLAVRNAQQHDPASPILYGQITLQDKITDRKVFSFRQNQLDLFNLPKMPREKEQP